MVSVSSAFTSKEHDVLGGKAKILRVRQSGDVWQFRMWIADEGKYIRQSLRTRDYESAVERAEKIVFDTLGDIKSGRKIFGITLGELVDAYVRYRQIDVENSDITAGRLVTIKSQLKHFIAFKSAELKLAELERNSYYEYAAWRKKTHETVRNVTLRNEEATINHMMNFAYREGLSHISKLNFRKLKVDMKEEVKRRGIFSLLEYDDLVRFMRTYSSKKECQNEQERLERLLVRDCVLIASNTMLRVGELWNLRWGDVININEEKDSRGQLVKLVTINVRAEISKTGRRRQIVSRGGEYFERLKRRAKYTKDSDYVFTSVNGKSRFTRQKWYLHWKALMNGIGIEHKKRNITWYSLRHFGITCRLRADVSVYDISEMAGTSVVNIQNHYGHIDTGMLKRAALKNFIVDKNGIVETI